MVVVAPLQLPLMNLEQNYSGQLLMLHSIPPLDFRADLTMVRAVDVESPLALDVQASSFLLLAQLVRQIEQYNLQNVAVV